MKIFICTILDILSFEYLCQLLVDNNCAMLILKMLSIWFANPPQKPQDTINRDGLNSKSKDAVMGAAWLQAMPDIPELE